MVDVFLDVMLFVVLSKQHETILGQKDAGLVLGLCGMLRVGGRSQKGDSSGDQDQYLV